MFSTPPRPIHRWKTFWLGLFILAFLTWAWARSRDHYELVMLRPGARNWYGFVSSRGHASWITMKNLSPGAIASRTNWGSILLPEKAPWFAPPVVSQSSDMPFAGASRSAHGIAHWLLTFLFFLTWSTFLALRWMRMKRIPAGSAELERSGSGPGHL
jgi:hypothetical protein